MTTEDLLNAVAERAEAFAAYIENLPPAAFDAPSGDGEWTIAELAGHVAEFPRTFAAEAVRLAADLGVTVGRRLDDEGRLEALRTLEGRGPAEAAAFVREQAAEALAMLRQVRDEAWANEGSVGSDGSPITAKGVVERMIAHHLEAHVQQAKAATASFRQRHA